MGKVYVIDGQESFKQLVPYECRSEELELQDLLERCPDLLMGEQIDPLNPRRWLQIQREMPVPDPGTGAARWSIDFLFVDQDAVPTFVEVKRYADTRARREVIGQMFEYAANGHYYWMAGELRSASEKTAALGGASLAETLSRLSPEGGPDADAFFDQVQKNLRQGRLRLVFFLERAPDELKSLVEFLNKSFEHIEVLLVQAQMFHDPANPARLVLVPTLFGYTEEVRQARRAQTPNAGQSQRWTEESFCASQNSADPLLAEAINKLITFGKSAQWLNWGGGVTGSFYFINPDICPRSFLTVSTKGRLNINFGYLNGSSKADDLFLRLKTFLLGRGVSLPDNLGSRYPGFSGSEWAPWVDGLVAALTPQTFQRDAF